MKILTLRAFAREAPTLTEAVLVTHNRRAIGQFSPVPPDDQIPVIYMEGAAMAEEPVKKAIQPDRVKTDDRGRLSKGLGPLPGEESRDAYREFKPVPKPGKTK